MTRILQIAHLLLLLAGIALLGVLGWRAWTLADELEVVFAHADTNLSQLSLTLQQVNRPCGTKIKDLTLPCGALATLNKTVVKIGDAVVTTQRQERAITPHTIAAMDNLNRAADALTRTANAATQTLHGASLTLSTMNDSIASTKPLIEASTVTLGHIDSTLPTLSETTVNVKRMTADGARITKDAADEADKLSHPPKKKLGFWGGFWVGMQYVHKMMPSIF